jgi:hypothetical protein
LIYLSALPQPAYFNMPYLRNHGFCTTTMFEKTPIHYEHNQTNPEKTTKAKTQLSKNAQLILQQPKERKNSKNIVFNV